LAKPDIVDPVSEADLFLDFGRNEQAEEILKAGLKENPDNQQVRLKLLSIYADRKDTRTFASVAGEVRDSGNAAAWGKAAEIGRKLEPRNPMYRGDDNKETTELYQDEITIIQPAASLDFDLDFGAGEVESAVLDVPLDVTTTAQSGLDFDLGFIAPTAVAPAVKEADAVDLSEFKLNLDAPVPTKARVSDPT
jgi:pilus assembly protein FimV